MWQDHAEDNTNTKGSEELADVHEGRGKSWVVLSFRRSLGMSEERSMQLRTTDLLCTSKSHKEHGSTVKTVLCV